ncbi:recombinase RecT [Litorivivens sp.]|uniref:recombinase RecT n=1 Tax=Litorivivens sp. TaxID=2020868 RepID=UPI003567E0C4
MSETEGRQVVTAEPVKDVATSEIGAIMLNPELLAQAMTMAEQMAKSKVTVPDHLRGSVGDCYAIVLQSLQWKMSPFVVAQKTHIVSGKLGYEAQLVNAVVQAGGFIKGAFKYEYKGDDNSLECRVGAVIHGEDEITWGEWLSISQVTVKNSPLWKTNPRQQIGYLQVKNFVRAYLPAALLGVYTTDELEGTTSQQTPRSTSPRDITPEPTYITSEQVTEITDFINEHGMDAAAVRKFARVESLDKLRDEKFEPLMARLREKVATNDNA